MRRFLLILCLAACHQPFAPPGAVRMNPSNAYWSWWQQTEQCSGITGDMNRIQWFVVPSYFQSPKGETGGYWEPAHTIYLAGMFTDDSIMVRHEMLHDLLQTGDHPAAFDTCGLRHH